MLIELRVLVTTFLVVLICFTGYSTDKEKPGNTPAGYVFEDEIILPVTSVKDQSQSNTCWSFSALSFLESEMLRLGKPEVDLSEMFIVRHTYLEKAKRYIRLHGNQGFSAGGAFHDVTKIIKQFGIVPESAYSGLMNGETSHNHNNLDKILKQQVDDAINSKPSEKGKLCTEVFNSTLNNYLGKLPEYFEYEGKTYTPLTFATDFMGLNMDDYVEITSYTHHPFYSKFILEVPDNWSWDEIYNVPLNEMEEIIDYSLEKGYTIAWAADITEKGFATSNKGVAVLPSSSGQVNMPVEIPGWETLSEKDKERELYKLNFPVTEIEVTQEMRQIAFDNYETTDDHGLHIVGTAKNQEGKVFYKVKNSWGNYNGYNGFFYASKPYVNYKTMSLMVHKNAIPIHIREKLNLL